LVRLHAVVEGQTEETFANQILAPALGARNVFLDAHRITTGRKRGRVHRGGIATYAQLRRDVQLWMLQDHGRDARFTTMVDLYRLPPDFPGYQECHRQADPHARVTCLEEKLGEDIDDDRFIPYIQLHEFETLLFSGLEAFAEVFPDLPHLVSSLQAVRDAFESVEHINEHPEQSPSERISRLVPTYVKPVTGILIAQKIGLTTLRGECSHFAQWLDRLEALAAED